MDEKASTEDSSIIGRNEFSQNKALWKMLMAEFLGTLILVFVGCGSCLEPSAKYEFARVQRDDSTNLDFNVASYVKIALTFGLTLATLVQTIGHVSGCHVNPAVTLSMFATLDINLIRCLLFIVCQCAGAITGAAILWALLPENSRGQLGVTTVGNKIPTVSGLFFEVLLTFIFVLVIHAVCDARRGDLRGIPAISIGFGLAAVHLCGIQYTGSSVNPARSLGPAVMMNKWDLHWVYWVGPIVGGVLAGLLYKYVFRPRKESYDM